jgi:phosphomannomutase
MTISYVFDVDGTLTASRKVIEPTHKEFLLDWIDCKDVYLLTGSDAPKTIEQLTHDLWAQFIAYQCSGNEIYPYGSPKVYSFDPFRMQCTKDMYNTVLNEIVRDSKYPFKLPEDTGNHIEYRTGCINLSTIGRACSAEQREHYYEWDKVHKERESIVERLENHDYFRGLSCSIGGQISIDIVSSGANKAQVFHFLKHNGPIYFFGDKTSKGGNDYPFAEKLRPGVDKLFTVSGPEETFEILKSL